MHIVIEIDCDNLHDANLHLQIIKEQIKRKFGKDLRIEPEEETMITDNNCYGTHVAIMYPEGHPDRISFQKQFI